MTNPIPLKQYAETMWHASGESTEYKDNWHLHVICEKLEEVMNGGGILGIALPPCHSATYHVSVACAAWLPKSRDVMFSGYNAATVIERVSAMSGKRISGTALNEWDVGTASTLIVDYPRSHFVSGDTYDGWLKQAASRYQTIVVAGPRKGPNDLFADIMEVGGEVLSFPMHYVHGAGGNDYDPRDEIGQTLWPSLWSEKRIRETKRLPVYDEWDEWNWAMQQGLGTCL